jgi:capsular exopolysaccharide synthesis family protein
MNEGMLAAKKYWEILCRRRRLFIGTFLLFVVLVIAGMFAITPTYEATSKVLLVQPAQTVATLMSTLGIPLSSGSTAAQGNTYATEIALATLRPLLVRVITVVNLRDRDGSVLKPEKLIKWSALSTILPRPHIDVSELESSDILTIVSNSTNSRDAARMSNELARFYVEDRVTRLRVEYDAARTFLQKHIQDEKRQYDRVLLAKKNFMIAEKTLDLQTEIKALIDQVTSMEEKLVDLQTDLSGKSTDLTPVHPDIVQLVKKIDSLKNNLREKTQKDIAQIPVKGMKQSEIDLVVSVHQDLYKKLLNFLTAVNIAESAALSTISVVEAATVPSEPSYPEKTLTAVVANLLGLFWAFGLTIFVEYVDNTIRGQDDFRGYAAPLLGSIPRVRDQQIISADAPDATLLDAYQNTVTSMRLFNNNELPRTILICSTGPGEGASTTAVNLGIFHARAGIRVLLVDTDLKSPDIHRILDTPNSRGIAEVISGKATLEECVIRNAGWTGLSFLPSGGASADRPLSLYRDAMHDFVESAKKQYDIVIFGAAPMIVNEQALLLMDYLDAMIIVVRNGITTHSALSRIVGRLESARISLTGFVLN